MPHTALITLDSTKSDSQAHPLVSQGCESADMKEFSDNQQIVLGSVTVPGHEPHDGVMALPVYYPAFESISTHSMLPIDRLTCKITSTNP
jgi:hypothetical protein